jgi:heme exporter protein C
MRWALLVGLSVAVLLAYWVPPAQLFPQPELARIIFFHLPSAFVATLFAIFGAVASWRYLASRKMVWEFRALAATEMATAMACATMVTGILFSKVQWGAWWHWDPRQTSFLIVLLLLGAYFAVRMSFEEETARARAAAAYSTLTLLPLLFLIFVFPRLPQVAQKSLHPQHTVTRGEFSSDYWIVVASMFILLLVYCSWLYRMHVRTSEIAASVRDRNGNLEDSGGDTTARPVDRSVRLQQPHQ